MNNFQVQITLKGSKPKIWRRVVIPADLLLPDFHMVIQISMGWTDYHLHQFIKNGTNYRKRLRDDDFWNENEDVDYKKISVSDLLTQEKEKIEYEYDFGDGWEHQILLEKILPGEEKLKYPVCIAGKMNCPPEDCGGIPIYEQIVKILKNLEHKEYKSYMEWLGGDFDPEYFDIGEVNEILSSIKYKRRK